jgi:hypothetical protein
MQTSNPFDGGASPLARRRLSHPPVLRLLLGGGWLMHAVVLPPPGVPAAEPRPGTDPLESAPAQSQLRLPDLRTLPPSDLRLEVRRDGTRRLRLANTVWNAGIGRLELLGEPDPAARRMRVVQVAYAWDGSTLRKPVGEFAYHPTHAHWHLEGFAVYELWSLTPRGELDRIVAGGGKVSYCLIDTDPVGPNLPGFPRSRGFRGCGRLRQGLSLGWGAHYHAALDGQELELGDLPDGLYALRSTANPRGLLLEQDLGNNAAVVYLGIYGRQLFVISERALAREACLSYGAC